jgi:hypothetical protein
VSASKTFLRFAAECEAMASFARDPESRLMWRGFAARWSRYAKLVDSRFTRRHVGKMRRPQRRSKVDLSIDDEAAPADTETPCDGFRHRRERDRHRHGRPDGGAKVGRLRIVLLRLGDTFIDRLFLRGRKFDARRRGAVCCRVLGDTRHSYCVGSCLAGPGAAGRGAAHHHRDQPPRKDYCALSEDWTLACSASSAQNSWQKNRPSELHQHST